MPFEVTRESILSVSAEAAVICVENAMRVSVGACNEALEAAGGPALTEALRKKRFLPVGSAIAVEPGALPYKKLLVTSAPRWWNGECNELLVLRRCYENLLKLAEELGYRSLVTPVLSAFYYRFPLEEAVRIAAEAAGKSPLAITLAAETDRVYTLLRRAYRKPAIVSYVGCYRDHAVFELDNGLFARVDIRPEKRDMELRAFVEACYSYSCDPERLVLSEGEIERLRGIYLMSVDGEQNKNSFGT